MVADDACNEDKDRELQCSDAHHYFRQNLCNFPCAKFIFIESVTKIKIEKLVPARICHYGCDHQRDYHQLVVLNSFVLYLLSL